MDRKTPRPSEGHMRHQAPSTQLTYFMLHPRLYLHHSSCSSRKSRCSSMNYSSHSSLFKRPNSSNKLAATRSAARSCRLGLRPCSFSNPSCQSAKARFTTLTHTRGVETYSRMQPHNEFQLIIAVQMEMRTHISSQHLNVAIKAKIKIFTSSCLS